VDAGALLPTAADAAVFAGATLVLNATPGVDFLLTVSRTLQGGARAGLAAALGIGAGCAVYALAAALGLAALMAVHAQALQWVQWAGAAYLAWLGWRLLRDTVGPGRGAGPAAATAAAPAASRGAAAEFRTGLLTNLLNPKVALFFLAFLPQFVPAHTPSRTASLLLLGGWFVLQGTLFLCLLVAVSARLARLPASPGWRRALSATGAALFFALAWRLLRARPAAA
jgi:threonine/homoserine/homoserine lactone efflux protein